MHPSRPCSFAFMTVSFTIWGKDIALFLIELFLPCKKDKLPLLYKNPVFTLHPHAHGSVKDGWRHTKTIP